MVRMLLRARLWMASSWLVAIFAAGCKPTGVGPGPAGDGEENGQTAQVTVWGERFEVFIEHPAVVAGLPTRFATHVTDVLAREPRRAGPVKFVLRAAGHPPLEHIAPAPARPGIYTPELTFPAAGEWTVELSIPVEAGESVARLPPLAVHASREEAARATHPEIPEGIAFLKEQQWLVRTSVEPAGRRLLVERFRVAGRVVARPSSRAEVTPPLAGRLLAPPGGPLPSLGDRVEAGQTLALIEPPFTELMANLLETEAGVVRAKLDLELAEMALARIEKLAGLELKPAREREEAEFARRAARARHDAALALRAAYDRAGVVFVSPATEDGQSPGLPVAELKAPLAGFIIQIAAAQGEHVPAGRSVFTVLDPEWVHLEARIPEFDSGRAGAPAGALYELPDEPGRFVPVLAEGAGRAVFSSPVIDPATRTTCWVYEVKNPEGRLKVGMALTIHLETRRAEEALAVPESAIVEEEGRPVAFVQVAGETFAKRSLTLGIRDGGWVQVVEGINEGERVVTREAYAIRLAAAAAALPAHGHEH